MNHSHIVHSQVGYSPWILLTGLFLMLLIYCYAANFGGNSHKKWPKYRYVTWFLGLTCIAIALVGPIAHSSHINFVSHMYAHLLLGMLAPLFIALSFPLTLLLRTIKVQHARFISRLLKSEIVGFLSNPIIALLLNIGGLWILYTTNLYSSMHQHTLLHLFVHIHIFLAGYLFTISIIYFDPTPHRHHFPYRSICMILFLAGHDILSKYIFIHPPNFVPTEQSQVGGKVMYYGGDLVDLIIIFILCLQWYKTANQRVLLIKGQSN
ncbi:cytochrome c oxidase assembly protein [Gottfriedia solisilvae]|uniref:Membrane protein n=1 Tax=Gottfriedia solisilvae TaxID=1516104 RepID=A0A8J3ABV4_9BACI|nr:membrane protein [Gottfriedia solisilvae]